MQQQCDSYPISIFIAGDRTDANWAIREFCDKVGLCVTVTETDYIYTGGHEKGLIIGLINYPRFPLSPADLVNVAEYLAEHLMFVLDQKSFSIQYPQCTTRYIKDETSKMWRYLECNWSHGQMLGTIR